MREQEFRARDKVVQKMNRGGLQEKNLAEGTAREISQRGGDFSFQAHGDWKREETVPGGTTDRGRGSPGQERNVSRGQTERNRERYGESRKSQDRTGRDSLLAENREMPPPGYMGSHRDVLDGREEGRSIAWPDTLDQPLQAGPDAAQGTEAGKASAEHGGMEKGVRQNPGRESPGHRKAPVEKLGETETIRKYSTYEKQNRLQTQNSREAVSGKIFLRKDRDMDRTDDTQETDLVHPKIPGNGEKNSVESAEALQSGYGRLRISAVERQHTQKRQRAYAKAWRDIDSGSGSFPQNPEMAGRKTEAEFGVQASDSDRVAKSTEERFQETGMRQSEKPKLDKQKQKRRKSEKQSAQKLKPEERRLQRLKQQSFGEKERAVSRKPLKMQGHTAVEKRIPRKITHTSGHSGEKPGNQDGDGSNRDSSSSGIKKERGKLRFELDSGSGKPEESLLKRTGGGLVHTAQSAAVGKFHQKIREVEQDNAGVESAHKAEAAVERAAGRAYRMRRERLRSRPYRAMKRAEKRTMAVERDAALKKLQEDYPQLQKKAFAKWVQKQKIKKKYAAAAREASKGAGHSAKVLSAAGRTFRRAAEYVKKKAGGTAVGIILAGVLLFSMCGSLFTSCSSLFTGAGSSLMSACYLAEDREISSAELRYTELETDLQLDIANTEWYHSGYDEYRYNIGEIGHNPFELMGYLSAVYDDFTCAQVEPELNRLFSLQYRLTREEVTETRTYTDEEGEEQEYEWRILKTVLSARPLSEILSSSLAAGEQTERYAVYMETYGGRQSFSNPFDFSWLGSVTSSYGYRVHPVRGGRDLHRGVDIGAAWGTPIRAIQDGQVVSAGEAGSYGLCLVIQGEDGCQSRYAHCSSLAVSAGQTVRKGDVVAYVGDTGSSTGPHLHLEVMRGGEYLDPIYFVENGGGGYTTGGNAAGRPQFPADPGTPMGDGTFEAVREEAERHMGRPYVWGGSSPDTSFDCSGYVSWVINQSGAGSVGRQTAQGLCNLCTPVSWEDLRPGDLVFFTGTYSSLTPVSHVGIYMGGGRMAHAGDPIGYADIGNSRYWKQHFYCGGRLP